MNKKKKFGISTTCLKKDDSELTRHIDIFINAGIRILELDTHNRKSLPLENKEFVLKLKKKLKDNKIIINSLHSPCYHPITHHNKKEREAALCDIFNVMRRSLPLIEYSEQKPFFVIHCGHHLTVTDAKQQLEYGIKSMSEIINNPLSKNYRLAVENLLSSHFAGRPSEILKILKYFEKEKLFFCLDTSHSIYENSPIEFLDSCYDFIGTTHVSDNFNQPVAELHAIPMTILNSKINWKDFFNKLGKKLDTIIYEILHPEYISNDIWLKMAVLSMKQAQRYMD